MPEPADILIVGAGAAGLMAAIFAGRAAPGARVVLLDGSRRVGVKILVAGGGRCNVTHFQVDERQYAGSSPNAIRRILRRFDVPETVEFFRNLGVSLKREDTGKLFPTTDRAQTVLDALLTEVRRVGVDLRFPRRVDHVERLADGRFLVAGDWGSVEAGRVILATGGRALPKSGSDGRGFEIVRSLGHTTTSRIFPALVPLVLEAGHFVRDLSGIAVPATLEVRGGTGKKIKEFTNSTLCTHFGLSGPAVLDISRYYLDAKFDDPGATLVINWLPGETFDTIARHIDALGAKTPLSLLRDRLPERLARAILDRVGLDPNRPGGQISREDRRRLAHSLVEMPLPVTGDRGFTHAEVTAGGVPLKEVDLNTMGSRIQPGLYLCGEILDVDGRIGGFNFQWAWASGFVAGTAAGEAVGTGAPTPADVSAGGDGR